MQFLMGIVVGLWANLVILAALGAVDPGSNPGSPTHTVLLT